MDIPLTSAALPALLPKNSGYQFVCYADACSGVPHAPHAETFAAINRVVRRLQPQPEFICFPGDEIIGLTADAEALRAQWQYWFTEEMGWLNRDEIPLYPTTANHTVYDPVSEAIFREVMAHLPTNGPPGQQGLSYFIRRRAAGADGPESDLLMIFINTLWSGLGGEGYAEVDWLEQTLTEHADAGVKMVFGHHPIFPVNGFVGSQQREVNHEIGEEIWALLVGHGVVAYWCSHILAFDVQVHQGVLQILTAGAGTAHRMPEGVEYLHAVQAALDHTELRYQVIDQEGAVREWLTWPLPEDDATEWSPLKSCEQPALWHEQMVPTPEKTPIYGLLISGHAADNLDGSPQTLFSAWEAGAALAPLWVGLQGKKQRLVILLAPQAGRSPHLWTGPVLPPNQPFSIQLAFHAGMGPGGLLWRWDEKTPWSSLRGSAAWGIQRLTWPSRWSVGHGQHGPEDRPFRGQALTVACRTLVVAL